MRSRFKDRELGTIKVDERGSAEAGAAGRVGCFDVGNFCEIAGCRSVGSNSIISSEATSGREVSACLRAFYCGTFALWVLLIVLSATKFESPVCEGGLMRSRFKDEELGAIEVDERGGAEAGAAGRVSCFDVGNFCDGVGCRSAGPNGVISSEATSGREVSACLWAFCCGTFSLWLLLIVLLETRFESPVREGGLMGSRFIDRELGAIEADERGGAEAGAAGGVGCFDVDNFCDRVGCRSAGPNCVIREASACLRAFCSTESGYWCGSTMSRRVRASSSSSPLKRSRCKPSGRRLWSQ